MKEIGNTEEDPKTNDKDAKRVRIPAVTGNIEKASYF